MDFSLVVVRSFANHECGEAIEDEEAIRSLVDGQYANHVVKVARRSDHEIKQEG